MDRAGTAGVARRRGRPAAAIVAAAVLLLASFGVCVAGIPSAVLGRLQAAAPCGDADLDPAHRVCALADPGRADLGVLLVLAVPVAVTLAATAAATALVAQRRTALATATAAAAPALALAALLAGNAVLAVELHRIVHL